MKLTNAKTLKLETLVDDDDLKDRVSFKIVLDPATPDDKGIDSQVRDRNSWRLAEIPRGRQEGSAS